MKKNAFVLFIHALYIWLLGINIGAIITAGAFVAPVIFQAYTFLPDLGITNFDSGILMTQIFLKINTLLNFSAIIILIYELLMFNFRNKKDFFSLLLNGIIVYLIFTFTFFYTPKIVEAQEQGAASVATPEFASIHHQSEYVFQFLLILLSINLVWRVIVLYKNIQTKAKNK
ncbi:DUF4149 domain-containing protein [Helicobacter sp. faydin-H20]|uniref:DUF4149 domain-containing protein n=1 Tax=Helicobacter anatolicus TaxID=2905874 RepID=UPI001E5F6877|nr:DUF4149 domain-containing protein [Helicobacter anatolicus]MCE3036461.1 DUF4149 domain-containing protein [Helicobacter anatolicus]